MSKLLALFLGFSLLLACNDTPYEEPPLPELPEEPTPGETVYTIDQDMTWTSDTVVSGVWYIAAGVTLRIEAGVEVSFLPGTGLVVDGILVLAGTAEAPVRFDNASTLSVGNFGVSVGGSGDLSQLANVSFDGVSLHLEGEAAASITAAAFSNSTLLISNRTQAFAVIDSSFIDGQGELQDGIVAMEVGNLLVSGSSFANLLHGILFDGGGDSPELTVQGSSFDRVGSSITSGLAGANHRVEVGTTTVTNTSYHAFDFWNATVSIRDSTVSQSSSHGIVADRLSTLSLFDTSVSGTVLSCVAALGSMTGTNLNLSDCGAAGVWAGSGGCTLDGGTILDTSQSGVRCEGPVIVDGTSLASTGRSAVSSVDGSVTVIDAVISDSQGSGVTSYIGDISVTGSTISSVGESGVFAQFGSVTVSDTTVSDCRLYGVRGYQGDVDLQSGGDGNTLSDIDVHGIVVDNGVFSGTDLVISNVGGIGVFVDGGDATLSDTTISQTGSHGVQVVDGGLVISDSDGPVEVLSAGSTGVAVSGGYLSADGVIVRDSFGSGIDVYNGQGLLESCVVENAGSHGISGRQSPSLSVLNCLLSRSYNNGIMLSDGGSLLVTGTTIDEPGLIGIYGYRADTQVVDSSIASPGQYGIYVYDGSLSVSSSIVSNSASHGILSSFSDTTIDGVQIVDLSPAGDQNSVGGIGISVSSSSATISNSLVDKALSYGISILEGSISSSTISNGGYTGIYVSGHSASSISSSNITDNQFRGIQTVSFGANLTDVSNNNITGNADWGLVYAQTVADNYIADNKGVTGVDTTTGGSLDGILDTSGTQIFAADVISSPSSTPLSGTGPASL